MKEIEIRYNEFKRIESEFKAAERNKDEEKMAALQAEYAEKFSAYNRVFNLYKTSREAGNTDIDIDDVIHNPETLIRELNDADITRLTISSTWSSMVELAYAFEKAGFKCSGMCEVFDKCASFDFEKRCEVRNKRPAFIFEKVA